MKRFLSCAFFYALLHVNRGARAEKNPPANKNTAKQAKLHFLKNSDFAGHGLHASPSAWDGYHPDRPFFWLHIPKTGSSFIVTYLYWATGGAHLTKPGLYRYPEVSSLQQTDLRQIVNGRLYQLCSQRQYLSFKSVRDSPQSFMCFYGLGSHSRVPPSFNGNVVVWLREPKSRLISQIRHYGPKNPSEYNFAAGCQTVMVLGIRSGYRCETKLKEPLNDADLQEALSRINKAAFVGLLEHYGMCICLFHAMFGGQLPVRKEELVSTRAHRPGSLRASQLRAVDNVDNKFDESLYSQAVTRLKQDVQRHRTLAIELCQEAWPEISEHVASFLEMSLEDLNASSSQASTAENLIDGAHACIAQLAQPERSC